MTIRAFRPVQLVGVPDNVRVNVSQFTPSTHVLSSNEPPPAAVPAQFTAEPAGLSVPALGVADRKRVAERTSTTKIALVIKRSVPMVTRPVMRKEFVFIEDLPFFSVNALSSA